jgi:hypothetical protein
MQNGNRAALRRRCAECASALYRRCTEVAPRVAPSVAIDNARRAMSHIANDPPFAL